MKLIDANLLLYAVNRDGVHHVAAKAWLEGALAADEPVALPWAVLLAFLRISTNARVFARPLKPAQAIEVVNGWLALPSVRILEAGDEHWHVLKTLLVESGTAGNLTTDAHLAALTIENGCELCSTDADFLRFPHLRWSNPLGARSRP